MRFRFLLALTLVICSAYATDESAIMDDKPSSEAENITAVNEEQKGGMVSDIIKGIASGHLNVSEYYTSYEIISFIIAALTFVILIIEKTCHILSKIKDLIMGWRQKRVHEGDSQESGPMGMMINVPGLPPHFLPRPEDLSKIKELLLAKSYETVVVTGASRNVGLQGMGGIGKSVMAAAVARDEEVRQTFPDGVIWIALGQEPKLTQRQSDLAESLGYGTAVFNDLQQGQTRLSELLANKSCPLVIG